MSELTPQDVADAAVDWYERGRADERNRIAEKVRELEAEYTQHEGRWEDGFSFCAGLALAIIEEDTG